jgi:phospholipid/cholesterol/gamma-HCH transport system ATP-binding protein
MIEYRTCTRRSTSPCCDGVDLTVETGEMFALFGPSGTGKSVLLKTTIALITPDRGDVEVEGVSVFHGGKRARTSSAGRSGYVFQYAALFDSLNVFDNVAMGLPRTSSPPVRRRRRA